jgi:hypothetical protein
MIMEKTIKEMMQKAFWETDISDHPAKAFEQGFVVGANAVLEEIENIVTNNEDNTLCMARCLVDKIKELKGE